MLQWGRACGARDGSCRCRVGSPDQCFNGAAPVGRGKDGAMSLAPGRRRPAKSVWLVGAGCAPVAQWGRALAGAECRCSG